MSNSKKFPAIFLDRDGVVNKEVGYITSIEQIEIYDFARDAIRMFHDAGWKIIIVTNQSAVARGMLTEAKLYEINKYFMDCLPIDDIFLVAKHIRESLDGVENFDERDRQIAFGLVNLIKRNSSELPRNSSELPNRGDIVAKLREFRIGLSQDGKDFLN